MRHHYPALITALLSTECYPHPVSQVEVIETHISWVLLAGRYAYKIKKPVNLGFLDYSSLTLRHQYCLLELALNRRTAADLYLGVIAIGGTPTAPRLGAKEGAIEYAVKMWRFDADALLSSQLHNHALDETQCTHLGARIARFHQQIAVATADSPFGTLEAIWLPVEQNFSQLRPSMPDQAALQQLERWSHSQFQHLSPLMAQRRVDGYVRECHGDLHLGNIALIDQQPVPFDAIEFNDNLRWIDVMSEIAFLCMDLHHQGESALAWTTLNGYLTISGDYQGVGLLRFYMVYRAMVRAKVAALTMVEHLGNGSQRQRDWSESVGYLHLAQRLERGPPPQLILTHGPSGSGKSYWSRQLQARLGLIWLRSDVERKRLFGLAADASSHQAGIAGFYSAKVGEHTYQQLYQLTQRLLEYGFGVVVDATFLLAAQRAPFMALADSLNIRVTILDLSAQRASDLADHIEQRRAAGDDPSEATTEVMLRQCEQMEALTPAERAQALRFPADATATWLWDSWGD